MIIIIDIVNKIVVYTMEDYNKDLYPSQFSETKIHPHQFPNTSEMPLDSTESLQLPPIDSTLKSLGPTEKLPQYKHIKIDNAEYSSCRDTNYGADFINKLYTCAETKMNQPAT